MYMGSDSSDEGLTYEAGRSAGAVGHGEDGTEAGLAAVHALVGVVDALERERLDAGTDAGRRGERERVLRVLGGAARPPLDRTTCADERQRRDRQRLEDGGHQQ